jgi:hypothetical protein
LGAVRVRGRFSSELLNRRWTSPREFRKNWHSYCPSTCAPPNPVLIILPISQQCCWICYHPVTLWSTVIGVCSPEVHPVHSYLMKLTTDSLGHGIPRCILAPELGRGLAREPRRACARVVCVMRINSRAHKQHKSIIVEYKSCSPSHLLLSGRTGTEKRFVPADVRAPWELSRRLHDHFLECMNDV